jgi:hypothetical protein
MSKGSNPQTIFEQSRRIQNQFLGYGKKMEEKLNAVLFDVALNENK